MPNQLVSHIRFQVSCATSPLLITDHKPLLGLLAVFKPIPATCAARMQRWALLLSAYNYTLRYRRGVENSNADCMSRLPLPSDDEDHLENNVMMMELDSSPVTFVDIKR